MRMHRPERVFRSVRPWPACCCGPGWPARRPWGSSHPAWRGPAARSCRRGSVHVVPVLEGTVQDRLGHAVEQVPGHVADQPLAGRVVEDFADHGARPQSSSCSCGYRPSGPSPVGIPAHRLDGLAVGGRAALGGPAAHRDFRDEVCAGQMSFAGKAGRRRPHRRHPGEGRRPPGPHSSGRGMFPVRRPSRAAASRSLGWHTTIVASPVAHRGSRGRGDTCAGRFVGPRQFRGQNAVERQLCSPGQPRQQAPCRWTAG